MAIFTQDKRALRIDTPLGKDVLLLERFDGEEPVSAPFHFRLDLLSEKPDLSPADLLGKDVTVSIDFGSQTRVLNGIVARFAQAGRGARLTRYRAEMVPQLWLASLVQNSRIFQQMSTGDIAAEVLKDMGIEHRLALTRRYEPRNYCAQYRETNLAFLSRILEEDGIHYFHEHSKDAHKLVLSDTSAQNPACPGKGARIAVLQSGADPLTAKEPIVSDLERETSVVSGKITYWDHHFELPGKTLDAEQPVGSSSDPTEVYDYPGGYAKRFDGVDEGGGEQSSQLQKIFDQNQRTVKVRANEAESAQTVVRGASNCPFLVAGHRFTIEKHYRADFSTEYFIRAVRHAASVETYENTNGAPFTYGATFECIPASVPYAPPRRTPRPRVEGSQTAVVVGPEGAEIFTDKYGRVKVQFHWDREGQRNAGSSCWVRVATAWAGNNWGTIHIPRVGQEVLIAFLEGDPDQPIVMGSVWNADQMPPYALPDNRTQSGIKSRSTPDGSAENFNEIRMEDKKGSELLYIHAEKDKSVVVENDRTETVGHDESISIGENRSESVGADETVSVGGDQTLSVGGNRTRSVAKDESVSVGGNRSESVSGNSAVSVDGNLNTNVGKDESRSVGGERSVSIGKDDKLQVGKKLLVDAGDEIVLKTGKASITMKKDGTITIKGKDITLNGSGKVNVKASSDVTIKGSQVKTN